MRKIYVIAGNYREFSNWCLENKVSTSSPLVEYVSTEGAGLRTISRNNPEIICIGTYRQRRDFEELEHVIRERTRPVVQIVEKPVYVYVEKPAEPKKPVEYVQEFARKIAWRVVTI